MTALFLLWNCDTTQTVLWFRQEERQFVRLYLGGGFDLIAKSEQGLLADLFLTLIEEQQERMDHDGAARRAEVRLRLGAIETGFRWLDALFDFEMGTFRVEDQARAALIAIIDGGDEPPPGTESASCAGLESRPPRAETVDAAKMAVDQLKAVNANPNHQHLDPWAVALLFEEVLSGGVRGEAGREDLARYWYAGRPDLSLSPPLAIIDQIGALTGPAVHRAIVVAEMLDASRGWLRVLRNRGLSASRSLLALIERSGLAPSAMRAALETAGYSQDQLALAFRENAITRLDFRLLSSWQTQNTGRCAILL